MRLESRRSCRLCKLFIKLPAATSLILNGACANYSQPEANLVTLAQLAVGIRTATFLLGKLNIDQNSPSRTPTARIEFLYLLRLTRDACIKIFGNDSHPLASDWLLWLNQNALLIKTDPTGLGSLLPLINQLSTEASNIVSNAMGDSSSSIVSIQVDLPAEEQEYPANSSGSAETQLHLIASLTHASTPRRPMWSGSPGAPSPKRPSTVLSLQIPSPPPFSECPTPSSAVSIVDDDDDNWSVAVDIDSVPPSWPRAPSPAASSPVAVELGSVSSTAGSDGVPACSKLLHTVPLPFLDDSERVVAVVPLRAPRPMNMLPGWWCWTCTSAVCLARSLGSPPPCPRRLEDSAVRRLALEVTTVFLVDRGQFFTSSAPDLRFLWVILWRCQTPKRMLGLVGCCKQNAICIFFGHCSY